MPAYQCSTEGNAVHRAKSFTVHAPNELWAHELAAKRAGYPLGFDEYLARRAFVPSTPTLEVQPIPTLTNSVA